MHPLAGQTEDSRKADFLASPPEERYGLPAQLIPERGAWSGPQRFADGTASGRRQQSAAGAGGGAGGRSRGFEKGKRQLRGKLHLRRDMEGFVHRGYVYAGPVCQAWQWRGPRVARQFVT